MKRDRILKVFQDAGMIFEKGRYVKGYPRLSGILPDHSQTAEVIGIPTRVKIVNLVGLETTPELQENNRALAHALIDLVYPDQREPVRQAFDKAAGQLQPGQSQVVADLDRVGFALQASRVSPTITALFMRFEWRVA